jgi:hypothetical protein
LRAEHRKREHCACIAAASHLRRRERLLRLRQLSPQRLRLLASRRGCRLQRRGVGRRHVSSGGARRSGCRSRVCSRRQLRAQRLNLRRSCGRHGQRFRLGGGGARACLCAHKRGISERRADDKVMQPWGVMMWGRVRAFQLLCGRVALRRRGRELRAHRVRLCSCGGARLRLGGGVLRLRRRLRGGRGGAGGGVCGGGLQRRRALTRRCGGRERHTRWARKRQKHGRKRKRKRKQSVTNRTVHKAKPSA